MTPQQENQYQHTIHVTNQNPEINNDNTFVYFQQFGNVIEAKIYPGDNGLYALVSYKSEISQLNALNCKDHQLCDSRIICKKFEMTPKYSNHNETTLKDASKNNDEHDKSINIDTELIIDEFEQRIFICGLPGSCTIKILKQHFINFGTIKDANIIFAPKTNESTGFGFIQFYSSQSTNAVLDQEKHIINGSVLQCKLAQSSINELDESIVNNNIGPINDDYWLLNCNDSNSICNNDKNITSNYKKQSSLMSKAQDTTIDSSRKFSKDLKPNENDCLITFETEDLDSDQWLHKASDILDTNIFSHKKNNLKNDDDEDIIKVSDLNESDDKYGINDNSETVTDPSPFAKNMLTPKNLSFAIHNDGCSKSLKNIEKKLDHQKVQEFSSFKSTEKNSSSKETNPSSFTNAVSQKKNLKQLSDIDSYNEKILDSAKFEEIALAKLADEKFLSYPISNKYPVKKYQHKHGQYYLSNPNIRFSYKYFMVQETPELNEEVNSVGNSYKNSPGNTQYKNVHKKWSQNNKKNDRRNYQKDFVTQHQENNSIDNHQLMNSFQGINLNQQNHLKMKYINDQILNQQQTNIMAGPQSDNMILIPRRNNIIIDPHTQGLMNQNMGVGYQVNNMQSNQHESMIPLEINEIQMNEQLNMQYPSYGQYNLQPDCQMNNYDNIYVQQQYDNMQDYNQNVAQNYNSSFNQEPFENNYYDNHQNISNHNKNQYCNQQINNQAPENYTEHYYNNSQTQNQPNYEYNYPQNEDSVYNMQSYTSKNPNNNNLETTLDYQQSKYNAYHGYQNNQSENIEYHDNRQHENQNSYDYKENYEMNQNFRQNQMDVQTGYNQESYYSNYNQESAHNQSAHSYDLQNQNNYPINYNQRYPNHMDGMDSFYVHQSKFFYSNIYR